MERDRLRGCRCSIIVVAVFLLGVICRSAAAVDPLLGVSPQDESYYKELLSLGTIKCKDVSNKFAKSQLNDDFCDCPDGSDEPGTSACPNGKFYCKNAGHAPVVLFSSRVNDGICDCCDGSDEYDGKIKCPNTCWEAGKVAREKLRKKIATYQEGVTIRRQQIDQAKLSIAKEEGELSKLKDEEKTLKGLVEQLKERKELIEKAEEKERLQKEKEEKEREEAQASKEKEIKADDSEPTQNDMHDSTATQDSAEDHHESVNEPKHNDHSVKEALSNHGEGDNEDSLQDSAEDHHESVNEPELNDHSVKEALSNHGEGDSEDSLQNTKQEEDPTNDGKPGLEAGDQDESVAEDTESLSREELGRLVASRWTGEKTEQHTNDLDGPPREDHQNPDETPNETNDEEDIGYSSDDDEHRYDVDDDSDDQVDDIGGEDQYDSSPSQNPESDDESDFSDITGTSSSSWLEKIQKKVKSIFKAVSLFQTPVNISDATYVRKEYDESSAKLSKIQSRISSLTKKLKTDFGPEKEFYSFYGQCFESKQNKYVYKVCPFKQATQEEGYSTTRLGSWEKFEDSYRIMQFLNGDKCWNGPDRSLKVRLRCGLKNELTDVDEPSRCEYMAVLSTPALCLDSRLKELQDKLESLNKDQPQGHDEL